MLSAVIEWVSSITPDSWLGAILAGLAATLIASTWVWFARRSQPYVPGTQEYRDRLREQRIRDATAKQANEIVYSAKIGNTDLKLFSGDITASTAQVIVSSDDTLLSASGGVAKSIVGAAGRSIRQNLRELASRDIPRGALAITGGGLTKFFYILHAVVLTKAPEYTEYPSKDEIRTLVQRIVHVADAAGIESLALPVLAGGTAAKKLREQGLKSDQDMIVFLMACLAEALRCPNIALKTVFLIVFDSKSLTEELTAALSAQLVKAG